MGSINKSSPTGTKLAGWYNVSPFSIGSLLGNNDLSSFVVSTAIDLRCSTSSSFLFFKGSIDSGLYVILFFLGSIPNLGNRKFDKPAKTVKAVGKTALSYNCVEERNCQIFIVNSYISVITIRYLFYCY